MLFLLWHSTERRLFGGLFVCGHSRLLLSWVKLFCFCISFTFWTFLNLIADFSYKKVGFLTLHHNYSRVHLFTCNLWFPLGKRTGVCVCVCARAEKGKMGTSAALWGLFTIFIYLYAPVIERASRNNTQQLLVIFGFFTAIAYVFCTRNACLSPAAGPHCTRVIHTTCKIKAKAQNNVNVLICLHIQPKIGHPSHQMHTHINRMLETASYKIMLPLTCSPLGQK